jgi:hypothetical protein
MVEVALLHGVVVYRDAGRRISSREVRDEPERSVDAECSVLFAPVGECVEVVVRVLSQVWIPPRSEAHLSFVYPVQDCVFPPRNGILLLVLKECRRTSNVLSITSPKDAPRPAPPRRSRIRPAVPCSKPHVPTLTSITRRCTTILPLRYQLVLQSSSTLSYLYHWSLRRLA